MATEILALGVRTANLLDEAKSLVACASLAAAGMEYDATPLKNVTDLAIDKIDAALEMVDEMREALRTGLTP